MPAENELQTELIELRRRLAECERAQGEWRLTEMALRESQRRLSTLLSNLPGMAYRCRKDAEWTMQFVSEGCKSLTGYDSVDLIDNRVLPWNELLHREDRQRVRKEVQEAVERRQNFEIVYRIRTATGGEKWVWERGIGLVDEDGQVNDIEGFITDISERIHVERELERRVEDRTAELAEANRQLRENNNELRAIYDAVVDGVIIVDLETGKCVRANPQMASMLGYTLEDLPVDASKVHRPEDMPEITEKFQAQAAGRLPLAENVPFLHKDGSDIYADISGAAMIYKERPCLVSFVRNVTERRKAEESRRQSENRFRAIFEEAPVGMVIGNPDRTIARVNKALCEMTGYRPEELIGKNVQVFMHPEDRDVSAPFVEKLLSGEISSFTVERRYLAKGARPFWAQATTATIYDNNGKLAFGLGIVEDIDDRRRAQEALERQRKTLWHMLRSSDHERQLIAYDIHDGLAQQLAAAAMHFQAYEYVKDRDSVSAKAAFDAGLQMLRQAHSEARRLISGVRPPILDESGIVAALMHMVQDHTMAGGPKIEFQSDVNFGRLEPVLENAIYRIAQEALANACKHGHSPKVKVAIEQNGESIRLAVRDWGVGFDLNSVGDNCFGLDGIRERTRLLDGELGITSRPGEGTNIEVVLPLMPLFKILDGRNDSC